MSPIVRSSSHRGWRRLRLIFSLIGGAVALWFIPPPLYFQFDRFLAGLPQQYLGFDANRYLADAPQRSGIELAALVAAKFLAGVLVVWLLYAVIQFVRRGFQPSADKQKHESRNA